MSKYQKALNWIKDNAYIEEEDYDYEENIQLTYSKLEHSSDVIETLQELIDKQEKQEKYRWHDLRKDPDDLPEVEEEVLIEYVDTFNGEILHKTDYNDFEFGGEDPFGDENVWEGSYLWVNQCSNEKYIGWKKIKKLDEE